MLSSFPSRAIISHRGLNRKAPENTLPAFELAARAGATWIETDVDILADGTLFLCHDATLERTTDRSGGFYELKAADLDSIDAGAWFSPEYAGTRLPKLRELIELANREKLNCNLELKCSASAPLARRMLEELLVELRGLDSERQVIISSFNHLLLAELHRKQPDLALACLFEEGALWEDWQLRAELSGASFIHPASEGLRSEQVAAMRQAGYGVNIWTVNSRARANQLFGWGATGVFTDLADEFIDLQRP